MKRRTKILLGSFICCLMLVVIVMWSSVKHAFFNDRVSDVESAFLEMSPDLNREVRRYKEECYGNDTCNKNLFFERRNQIVARDWPRIYDRLSRFNNWGDGSLTRPYRDEFFREIQGYTPNKLRNEWVPVLQYRGGQLRLFPCSDTDRRRYVPRRVIQAGLCK